eukprot:TRINITY_DN3336_c1_g3_i1.p1 TRINITY_DN3336_c1_g3~~TRINITY_DN3336_c1_g3_i1.p1  ORF type:complete len:495 (+),score=53.73 TRINITY_DN3336_c1_g3_i1:502-1986(+)
MEQSEVKAAQQIPESASSAVASAIVTLNATALATAGSNFQDDILDISKGISDAFNSEGELKSKAIAVADALSLNSNLSSSVVGAGLLLAEQENQDAINNLIVELSLKSLNDTVTNLVEGAASVNFNATADALSQALQSEASNQLIDGSISSLLQSGSSASSRVVVRAFSIVIIGARRASSSAILRRLFRTGYIDSVASAYSSSAEENEAATQRSLGSFIEDSEDDVDVGEVVSEMLRVGGGSMSRVVVWAIAYSIASNQSPNIVSSLVVNGEIPTCENALVTAIDDGKGSACENTLYTSFFRARSVSLWRNLGTLSSRIITRGNTQYYRIIGRVCIRLIGASRTDAAGWLLSQAASSSQASAFIQVFVGLFSQEDCEVLRQVIQIAITNIGNNINQVSIISDITKQTGCEPEEVSPQPQVIDSELFTTVVECRRRPIRCQGSTKRNCCVDIQTKQVGDECQSLSRIFTYVGVCEEGVGPVVIRPNVGIECVCED